MSQRYRRQSPLRRLPYPCPTQVVFVVSYVRNWKAATTKSRRFNYNCQHNPQNLWYTCGCGAQNAVRNGSFCPATEGASAYHSCDMNVETQDSISCSTSRYPPNNDSLAFVVANPVFNSSLYGLILEIALITLRIDVHESSTMATMSSNITDGLLFVE
jgi:hypothetical protein